MAYNTEKLTREVYCNTCKLTMISAEPAPYCPKCGHELITKVKSVLIDESNK